MTQVEFKILTQAASSAGLGEKFFSLDLICRPSGVVVRGASCFTKRSGFEYRVRHGCQTVLPRPHQWLGRREVPGSILGRACRPSRSVFSMVFFRNSRKYGLGSLRKTPMQGTPPIVPGPIGLIPTSIHPTLFMLQSVHNL